MIARSRRRPRLLHDLPAHRCPGVGRYYGLRAECILRRHNPSLAAQRHRVAIAGESVEIGPVETREAFQSVKRSGGFKRLRVELQRRVRGIAARAAAAIFLGLARVWRRVSPQKKLGVATGRRLEQRPTVQLALQDWAAIAMRPDTTLEQRVA